MSSKERKARVWALATVLLIAILCVYAFGDEDPAQLAARQVEAERLRAEHEAERRNVADLLARDREARGKDALSFEELYRHNQERCTAKGSERAASPADPRIRRFLEVQWVHDVGAGWVLDAEQFGETLHVAMTAETSRGFMVSPCSVQRDFVAVFYLAFKGRKSDAHPVKLFNPAGREIGRFSRLWGYHCGD